MIIGIIFGILLGYFYPSIGIKTKFFGDGFIKLIRMMISPIIFTTVVLGITKMRGLSELGRIGVKAFIYFEVVSSFALFIGLVVANLTQPGAGLNIDITSLDKNSIVNYIPENKSKPTSGAVFILNIIPNTIVGAFAKGDILSILFIAILFGLGILHSGKNKESIVSFLEKLSGIFFAIVGFIMYLAPFGAFGGMAYTVASYGIDTLFSLGKLLLNVYITSALFITLVLGGIARFFGLSLWNFIKFIKEEIFVVLATSSSEAALPQLLIKLEKVGCGKTTTGLVLPIGYSFNLDGTSIYLSMAVLFIAQAFNVDLSLTQQLSILAILLLTSKGAAAVSGGGFIVLAATLSSFKILPVEGIILLLGVDKFMSEVRAITNLIGNGLATMVISKWENEFDPKKARRYKVVH